jgi:hypothetical protein
MKTLIQRQEACIARMREPRTSEKRTAKNYSAALRQYRKGAEKAGYPADQIQQQVQDIKDMFWLETNAES